MCFRYITYVIIYTSLTIYSYSNRLYLLLLIISIMFLIQYGYINDRLVIHCFVIALGIVCRGCVVVCNFYCRCSNIVGVGVCLWGMWVICFIRIIRDKLGMFAIGFWGTLVYLIIGALLNYSM